MSVLNRLFSGHIWQRILLITCFSLLAAACWFLGPWLGFGEARPLEATPARIVVMFALLVLFWIYWFRLPFFLTLAVIALTIVWVVGPYLLVGKGHPLESAERRAVLMALIVSVTLLYGLWRLVRALSINPGLLDNLVKKKAPSELDPIDSKAINAVIEHGMRYMRRIQLTVPLWRRFFGFRRSELPWFLVMGTPGSGKTAMLFSSGQSFPLPEQLNRQGKENPPTAHCECLFTNDGLFLDTAGKYVGEDGVAKREWVSLLQALKKYRPVYGINGVIVTLSAEDILHKGLGERLSLAATIRSRLDEMRQQLGVRFPVYVTITKLDLLTGFEAYFRNLTANEREQIWGVTLPWEGDSLSAAGELKSYLCQELEQLQHRLSSVMHLRQQKEYDLVDRKRMYALPQDFGLLSQGVTEVVQNIFFASRYDETQFYPTLRGVYFVSNCQPGQLTLRNNSTLLQKWRNLILQDKPQTPASLAHLKQDDVSLSDNIWGKHYFLTHLFRAVITRDRDLVSYNLHRQATSRLQNSFGHLATWGSAVWLFLALLASYQLNRGYLDALSTKLAVLNKQVTTYANKPVAAQLPSLLSATQNLSQYRGLDVAAPSWDWRYGLYTGFVVSYGTDSLYHFFLQHYLLPQMEKRATQALTQALQASDDDALWLALKSYLMLTGGGEMKTAWLVEQITSSWEQSGAIRPYGDRANFVAHLNALFSHADWRKHSQVPDAALIKEVRARLAEKPESARVWQRLKTDIADMAPVNLTLRGMVGGEAPQIFTVEDAELRQHGIPGLYTQAGWQQVVKKKIMFSLLALQNDDRWVMGRTGESANPIAMREAVLTRYLQEYGDYWQRFLSSVRLVSVDQIPAGTTQSSSLDIAFLRSLVADNSPLRALLLRAVRETTLVAVKPTGGDGIDRQITQSRLVQQAQKLQQKLDFREQQLIRQHLDNRFSSLRQFVQGEQQDGAKNQDFIQQQGTGLSNLLALLQDQYTRFVVYNSAFSDTGVQPLGIEAARIGALAGTWPEPVRNIVFPLLTGAFEKAQRRLVAKSITSIVEGPGEICRSRLQGRYPFADSDREVSVTDFERFFSIDGVVDSWFKQNLAEKVDTSRHPWRFKGTDDSTGLAFFEKVERIRNLFFAEGEGRRMALNFSASVHYLSPKVREFILNLDGNRLNYYHGPVVMQELAWPGTRRGSLINMSLSEEQAAALPDSTWRGDWALLHWLDAAVAVRENANNRLLMRWVKGKKHVELEIAGLSVEGALPGEILRDFRCPNNRELGQ
ncbi:type VI secretion system membrane subunit TssM [Serratia sp. NA_112.1]|uniref:type VI secretion system membrane subunit TssM n=1 Tax=Serratia sp. NA_112.1 TaxID=3415665 RepID=UPI004046DF3A